MIGPIKVDLTTAQWEFARRLVKRHESMGDCKLHGWRLTFPDYEGARAFQRGLYGELHDSSTRSFVTMTAISDKIDAAIVRATRGAA